MVRADHRPGRRGPAGLSGNRAEAAALEIWRDHLMRVILALLPLALAPAPALAQTPSERASRTLNRDVQSDRFRDAAVRSTLAQRHASGSLKERSRSARVRVSSSACSSRGC